MARLSALPEELLSRVLFMLPSRPCMDEFHDGREFMTANPCCVGFVGQPAGVAADEDYDFSDPVWARRDMVLNAELPRAGAVCRTWRDCAFALIES